MLNHQVPDEFLSQAQQVSTLVTPYLPLLGIIIGGIIVGIFAAHNRRKGNMEARSPDVNEIWIQQNLQSQELDKERKWRRRLENFSWELTRVFRNYVSRVQGGGSTDLTHHERLFHDTDPPSSEIKTKEEGV